MATNVQVNQTIHITLLWQGHKVSLMEINCITHDIPIHTSCRHVESDQGLGMRHVSSGRGSKTARDTVNVSEVTSRYVLYNAHSAWCAILETCLGVNT